MPELTHINSYPLKGAAGIAHDTSEVTPTGLAYDRAFMLIDAANRPITQREHPELAVVQTGIQSGYLRLAAPGQGTLEHSLDPAVFEGKEEVEVDVFDKVGTGIDQGDEAAEYFSGYLHEPVRLLRSAQPRWIRHNTRGEGGTHQMGFADGYAMTLGSLASLAALNEQLDEPVTTANFRLNGWFAGKSVEPWEEDYYRQLRVGKLQASVVRAIARCAVVNVDYTKETHKLPRERPVTKALHAHRRGFDPANGKNGDFFGVCLDIAHRPATAISVGDHIMVDRQAPERLFTLLSSNASVPQPRHPQHHPALESPSN